MNFLTIRDRDPVAAVAKRHGISEQTIYTWRKRFGGLQLENSRQSTIPWKRDWWGYLSLSRKESGT